jgi:hypothetical protein
MAKQRCLFCKRWFRPYIPLAARQRTCRRAACRSDLKKLLNRAWKRRRTVQLREGANRRQRVWAKEYPHYWRGYRKGHPDYVARDNQRRARAVRQERWGCSAKEE